MSSMQTLQHKLAALQEEHSTTAERLKRLRRKKASETDVNADFKLEQDIKEAESKLEELGKKIDDLVQKIQAIESGQLNENDVLKQEGLKPSTKPQSLPKSLVIGAALVFIGGIVWAINGSLTNSHSNFPTTPANSPTTSVQPTLSPPPTGLNNRFAGAWTTEGDHSTLYLMEMTIDNPQGGKLSGILKTQKRDGPPAQDLSVSGTGQGDAVNVTIYSHTVKASDGQVTQPVWNAELKLEGENLVWRSSQGSNDYFPSVVTLYKTPAPSP